MTRPTCAELLREFKRDGERTYKEAAKLLRTCGFDDRKTGRAHVVWTRGRYTLTLSLKRIVKKAKATIIRTVEHIHLEEENHA